MPAGRYVNRREEHWAGAGQGLDEQAQKVTTGDELSPTRELAVWLRALPSFFDLADHPLNEAERASVSERGFNCETAVVRDVLLRCLHLLGSVARGTSRDAVEQDGETHPHEVMEDAPAF